MIVRYIQIVIDAININAGEIPACECGSFQWVVQQRIERESKLLKVDGMGDLVTEDPSPDLYQQSIVLRCVACKALYQPQSGVWATPNQNQQYEGIPYGKPVVEAYSEGTESKVKEGDGVDGEGEYKEHRTGFEDGYGWPGKVGNDVEYSEESWQGLV